MDEKKPKNWHRMGAKTKLQKSWVWNGPVTELVSKYVTGYSLNCPCGLSELGTVKADIDPKKEDILREDMTKLSFKDETFDTVISDPPWKIGFYQRMRPFFECVRVCKVGGTIIYNAYWIPESKYAELKDTIIRQDMGWANTSIISIFKKTASIPPAPKGRGILEAIK